MKKIYINPDLTIVKIKTSTHLMDTSNVSVQGNYDSESITIASREESGWFDDDED